MSLEKKIIVEEEINIIGLSHDDYKYIIPGDKKITSKCEFLGHPKEQILERFEDGANANCTTCGSTYFRHYTSYEEENNIKELYKTKEDQ